MTIEDIALTLTPGIGTKGAVHLLEHFGDAEHIFAASDEELCSRTRLRPDLARRITQRVALPDAEREWTYCLKNNIHIVASTDPQYPPLLRETPDYPHVLYIRGNVDALTGRCLSMVGTRDATPYGQRMCNELIRGLAERVPRLCIVSGLAFGIDVTAHRAALAAGVQTVAVLPNPLPDVTPAQHRGVARDIVEAGGALVSELHSQVKQRGTFYLARNRIIAGLSAGTVVVESPCGGGSLMTAHCADGYNRTLMAVPGRAADRTSRGTNQLIRNKKAQLILTSEQIIEELMWDVTQPDVGPCPPPHALELTHDEAMLLDCLGTSEPLSADELATRCGFDAGELSAVLLGLEMVGAIRQLPGSRYVRLVKPISRV